MPVWPEKALHLASWLTSADCTISIIRERAPCRRALPQSAPGHCPRRRGRNIPSRGVPELSGSRPVVLEGGWCYPPMASVFQSSVRVMNEIRTRIRVGPDHTISGIAPAGLPPGEHVAVVTISAPPTPEKRSRVGDLPIHDIPWDSSISLRRADLYGDDGR